MAFITDHSYLDSPTFRGMRQNLMKTFDEIFILNLHGNSKRRETCPDGSKDKNVFDIQQGTAISLFVKNSNTYDCRVHYADLWGSRNRKYTTLLETDIHHTDWVEIDPVEPFYEFVPVNKKAKTEYFKGYKITDILTIGSNGIQTSRDNVVVDVNRVDLKNKILRFKEPRSSDDKVRNEFFSIKSGKYPPGDTRGWKLGDARAALQKDSAWENNIISYKYRPFDKRFLLYSDVMIDWPRPDVMQHLLKNNFTLCIGRAGLVASTSWDLVFCVSEICDHNLFYRGSSMNFPLYLYPKTTDAKQKKFLESSHWPAGKSGRVPNMSVEFVEELEKKVKLAFVSDGVGDLKKSFGPEDVFHYIYAVFHSPEYRKRYAEFLKIDFPRVPLPTSKPLFCKLCSVGDELTKLHLMKAEILEEQNKWPAFDIEGSDIVEKGYPKYVAHADRPQKGKVYINKDQYFEGIRPEVWEFHVGGYQVCEKWLKDRRNRELDYEDICHYQKITMALGETIKLMDQVDKVIDSNGGWPIK